MNGNWALITGASRGLGLQLVRRFWGDGWNVALVARDAKALSKIVGTLPVRVNQSNLVFSCDLSRSEEVNQLINALKASLPRLDALINNAAIHGPIGPLLTNNMIRWQETIQVNLLAPVALCRGLVELMGHSGGGSIINLSGGGATGPRANFTAYASSKAALVRFSETLSQEVEYLNIRVNCISPGAMRTSLLKEVVAVGINSSGKEEFSVAQKILDEGGASMDKVADLTLFLSGNAGSKITGKVISAIWDKWELWPKYSDELKVSDIYTLRRITARDRRVDWSDE
jgi:NAD(P)-dependent dehydrogenase (short-subunit alcohol dehydrogenase family)